MSGKTARLKGVYKGKRWRELRLQIFERDGWRCVFCGTGGRLECDHILPVAKGGALYETGNLRTLCRTCHIGITASGNRKVKSPIEIEWDNLVEQLAT